MCGVEEVLTPQETFEAGWDYPPRMGYFGVVSPRTCPHCPMVSTVWWALAMDGRPPSAPTGAQRAVNVRIEGEPESIRVADGDRAGIVTSVMNVHC